jgi:hypothetical protein
MDKECNLESAEEQTKTDAEGAQAASRAFSAKVNSFYKL